MKKLFLLLVIFCLVPLGVVFASETKSIYNNTFGKYVFNINNDGSYTVNNKKVGIIFYDNSTNVSVYKSNLKDVIAVKTERDTIGTTKIWSIITLSNNKSIEVKFHPGIDNNFEVNNKDIKTVIKDNNCTGTENPKTVAKNSGHKYEEPVFMGFNNNNQNIYTSKNKSELSCVEKCFEECAWSPEFVIDIVAFSRSLNNVFFSATGKGWTAYYSYDIKANKITKTTLAKINKDKLKLTLIKKF